MLVLINKYLTFLFQVETKVLNQTVKRNIKRFPPDFMFQLNESEFEELKFQLESIEISNSLRSQIVTSKRGGTRTLPYAFTEQGVAMLSGVLNSDRAIQMNIAIMRAFVETRKFLLQQSDMQFQLNEIKEKLGSHDIQLSELYDALENLLDEKASQRKWEDGDKIGFKK